MDRSGYRSRVWPRKVKQTNGHGAIAQMSPVIQRVRRRLPQSLSVRFFCIPLSPLETQQSSSSSSSFRNLKFHPRDCTPSGSSVNTYHEEETSPLAPVAPRDKRSAAFRKFIFRLVNFGWSPAASRKTSALFRKDRWQIAGDKSQLARRTVGKIIGQLFRSVMSSRGGSDARCVERNFLNL